MAYARKTADQWKILGNFGYGWELVSGGYDFRRDALVDLKEYRASDQGSYKLIKRRIPITLADYVPFASYPAMLERRLHAQNTYNLHTRTRPNGCTCPICKPYAIGNGWLSDITKAGPSNDRDLYGATSIWAQNIEARG